MLLAAGHAVAASAPDLPAFDHQNSFLMMTPAQLYRLDDTVLSVDAARSKDQHSTNTTLMLGRKASPSLYGSLLAGHASAGQRNSLGGDGAFKILDQLVIGVGFRLRQDHGFADEHREAMHEAQLSQAVLIKGEAYEAGVAFWQLKLKEDRDSDTKLQHTTLVHGRWMPTSDLAVGLQARSTPRRWSYAASAEYALGDWKGEALYSQDPEDTALLLYYRIAAAWTVNLRLDRDSAGLGCSYTL